jgi:dipeptidyl aminopeptidase/acylaminoacyl peptidase
MQREQPVSFYNGRGALLKGALHHPRTRRLSAAGAILCHGMESNKESEKLIALSHLLADNGVLTLRFDFSFATGGADRFAEITYSGEVEDLQAAFDFLLAHRMGNIAIFGSSMGGTVAILFAAREPRVSTLVTLSAPVHPERLTERFLTPGDVEGWRADGFITYHGRRINASLLEDLQAIHVPQAAQRVSCPALVIHGDLDETVPVEEARELYTLLSGPKRLRIIEGGDHRFSRPDLMQIVLQDSLEWMTRHL